MRKLFTVAFVVVATMFAATSAFAQCGTTPISGDLIISSNTSLSGTYNVSGLFRVDPGVVCSVTPYTSGGCGELVINAATIEVMGDIIGDGSGYPGGTGGSGGTTGNNSNALTSCVNSGNCLPIDVSGGAAGTAASGPGAGSSGVAGTLGVGPKQSCNLGFGEDFGYVCGAGGAGAASGGSYGGLANQGGSGGSGGPYNSGNFPGADIATCVSPQAGVGGAGGAVAAVYGTATGTDIDLGSGGAGAGGGGKSASNGAPGGAGGAGGGLIALYSAGDMTIGAAATISVDGETSSFGGGTGGNGATSPTCCNDFCSDCLERTFSSGAGGGGGSGGGSGGGILLQAFGVADVTGTLRSAGGNGSNGASGGSGASCNYNAPLLCFGDNSGTAGPGTAGELGGGGSGGRIKIFQNPCQPNNISASVILDGGNGFSGSAGLGTYHLGDIGNIVGPTATTSADSVSCYGLSDGSASIVVSGGTPPFTYSWNDPGSQSSATAANLLAGSYEVTVIDSFGCELTETVVVEQPDTLTAQIFSPLIADCYGAFTGEASVVGLGGTEPYSYQWDDPALQTTDVATGLAAGFYEVEVTDVNGCTATDTITIGQVDPFAVSYTVTDVLCNGGNTGQATVTASGSNLTYVWDTTPIQTTATASNLAAGTYNVVISSSQTCDTTVTITVGEPAPLVLTTDFEQVSCNGGSDGEATVVPAGGTSPYTYLWSPSLQTNATAFGLAAGTYNVTVTDDNQCIETATVQVSEPSAIAIAVVIDSTSCNGGSDGAIECIPSGGTPGYTFEWNPGQVSGNPLTGISAGSYTVTVTDDNGCIGGPLNVLVPEPTPMLPTLVQEEDVSCNGAADGLAEVGVSGGTAPYTYLWNDPVGQTTALASNLAPGNYNVDITDANGCMVQVLNVDITEPDELIVSVVSTTPLTCDYSADGMAESEVTGGTIPYDYLWNDSSAQTGSIASDLDAGDYILTVTDANGCVATATATIDPPVNVLTADFSLSPDSGLQPLDITVTNLSVGATAFEWIFGDGNTQTTFDTDPFQYLYADSGSFDVTLIAYNDVTGCTATVTLPGGMYVIPTSELIIPNVITPNGDGLNDMFPIDPIANDFFPFKIRNIYDFKGEIYNRWGEKVYEWTQPLGGWEGRSTSGLNLKGGTYFYVITAKGVDGDAVTDYELKGDVLLVE